MQLPISQIVKGHVNEVLGLNMDLSAKRMEICKMCPIYSPRFGGTCNSNLYLNPYTNDVSNKKEDEDYIRGCGCRLSAKTTLPNANCPADKW